MDTLLKFFLKGSRNIGFLFIFILGLRAEPDPSASTFKVSEPTPCLQTPIMRTETIFLVRFLEELHFLKKPIGDLDYDKLIDDFMMAFDPHRMFFTQNDKNRFINQYSVSLELLLRGGSLTPAFDIFERFRTIVNQRVQWIIRRLSMDFNFEKEETYDTDRKESPWAKTGIELDCLWSKRLQHELISESLALASGVGKETNLLEEIIDNEPKKERSKKEFKCPTEEQCKEQLAKAKTQLIDQYKHFLNFMNQMEGIDVEEIFLNTLSQCYDPHTGFFSIDSMEEFSINHLRNSLVGIGAYLSEENGLCVVKELLPGGPAEQSKKLHPGDKILAVAQGDGEMVSIQGMKVRQSVKLIRGQLNSKVRLLIQPFDGEPSERRVVELIRGEVKLIENLASARLFYAPDPQGRYRKVGLIDLPAFYGANEPNMEDPHFLSEDVKRLILRLEDYGVEGLILDLRRNGGGLLEEAVKLSGLFLDSCPVVQIKDTANRIVRQFSDPKSCVWRGPLLILTTRLSASASEIVAGALQSVHRALIFGDKTTHGKGTVQAIIEMDRLSLFPCAQSILGAAKITLQKWYLPDGKSTQKHGVSADLSIPSLYDTLPLGESDLPNALDWDSINPIPMQIHDPACSWIRPNLLPYLQHWQSYRQTSQPAFEVYQRQLDYCQRKYKQKTFSINLKERVRLLAQDRAERKDLEEQSEQLLKFRKLYHKITLPNIQTTEKFINVFDIYEDEAVEIMLDWLCFLDYPQFQSLLPCYCLSWAIWNQFNVRDVY